MVVFSFNKKKTVKTALIITLAAVITVFCVIIAMERKEAVPSYAESKSTGRYSTEAPDTEAQLKFLSKFGIKADKRQKKQDEIIIPSEFNKVYTDYNELQKSVGLNLEPFKGETAERITYKVKNKEKYVTLLIFKARVIAGHLSTGVYGDGYEALNGTIG